jgi:hypothetical protein
VGFTLTVPTANLSNRIGFDWSYDYAWSLAEILREKDQSAGCEQIFLDLIWRSGSVVTYDPVPAAFLRVRLKSSGRDLFMATTGRSGNRNGIPSRRVIAGTGTVFR